MHINKHSPLFWFISGSMSVSCYGVFAGEGTSASSTSEAATGFEASTLPTTDKAGNTESTSTSITDPTSQGTTTSPTTITLTTDGSESSTTTLPVPEGCRDGLFDPSKEECDPTAYDLRSNLCDDNCTRRGLLAFVSSEVFTGALGGVSGADDKCIRLAKNIPKVQLPDEPKFRAWISAVDPLSILDPKELSSPNGVNPFKTCNKPYYQVNGSLLAENLGSLDADQVRITINELGELVPLDRKHVWTATDASGKPATANPVWHLDCSNWKSGDSGNFAGVAGSLKESEHWTNMTPIGCGGSAHIYCFEQATEPCSE